MDLKDIVIYGFGGFGREVASLINHINSVKRQWNIIGFIDDGVAVGTENRYGKVLGDIHFLNSFASPLSVVIAIANPLLLKKITTSITNNLIDFPNLIADNVFYFDNESVSMGKGNIITNFCRLSCDVQIGNFNILNGSVSLGHDVQMKDFNVLFPDTRISGQTRIGESNFFGARCFVNQCIEIGNDVKVSAGSYVMRSIRNSGLYAGNPARNVEF